MDNLENIIEGLLFVAGEGLDKGYIMEKLGITDKQLTKIIESLSEKYSKDCGIHLITYKNKIQMSSNPKYADDISLVLNPIRERNLSKATLETVAIIAYKQPVTRLEIENVRGVNSDYALQTLMNLKMIEVVGRKDAIGKPLLFGTTEEFLKRFDLHDLTDLPDYDELIKSIEKLEQESNALYNEFEIPDEEKEEVEENKDNLTNIFDENSSKEDIISKDNERVVINEYNENLEEELPDFLKDEKNLEKIE